MKVLALVLALLLTGLTSGWADNAAPDAGSERMASLIDGQLEAAAACTSDDQCVLVSTYCPFGCARAVNRMHLPLVELALAEYRAAYGEACLYRCREPRGAVCREQRCVPARAGDDLEIPEGSE